MNIAYYTNHKDLQGIKKTKYGYFIRLVSSYVTITTIKLTILENGYQIAKIKTEKNYFPTQYSTEYYDIEGNKIDSRKEWLSLQK